MGKMHRVANTIFFLPAASVLMIPSLLSVFRMLPCAVPCGGNDYLTELDKIQHAVLPQVKQRFTGAVCVEVMNSACSLCSVPSHEVKSFINIFYLLRKGDFIDFTVELVQPY